MITSDKPIGIIAGANVADVIEAHDTDANPLIQEQLPVADWGILALSWSFAGRGVADAYRVLAAYDNTVVFTNSVVAGTNQAGQSMDLEIYGPVEFQGTQPIQVAHMANSFSYDYQTGDPCEILLPPIGHYLQTNIIVAPVDLVGSTNYWAENYMTLIVPQSATTNTIVDGSVLASTNFASMGATGYSGARISVAGGTHIVTSSQPIYVEAYGFAYYDAYGFFGGVVP
jgi:hypothetical protein